MSDPAVSRSELSPRQESQSGVYRRESATSTHKNHFDEGAHSQPAQNESNDYDILHKELEQLKLDKLGNLPEAQSTGQPVNHRTHVRSATWGGPSDLEGALNHVALNLVNQLLDDDIAGDSGHEDDFGSPADPRQFDWSGQSWQETNFLHPGGSYGSLSSYSSADSALASDLRIMAHSQSVWAVTNAGLTPQDSVINTLKPSASAPPSAGSSPPSQEFLSRPQSSPLIQSDENVHMQSQLMMHNSIPGNRHSYPQAISGAYSSQPKIKQPLLATPSIPTGKDFMRSYRTGNGAFHTKPGYAPRYHNNRSFGNAPSRQYLGSYSQSPHQYHSKPPVQHYHGHQQYGQVQLRYSERQNRPPRLANKSRRFSDGVLYTSFDPSAQDSCSDPSVNGMTVEGGGGPPVAHPQMHSGMRVNKTRKTIVGRSHSFHYSTHGRSMHLYAPHNLTPGSSPPMPHDQRSYPPHQSYSSYGQRMYNKSYAPQSPGSYPIGNSQGLSYESGWPKPSQELHMQLELCLEEMKQFQIERKKAESDVTSFGYPPPVRNSFHGLVPRLPPNPTRVDKLIVDQFREHAKMEAFVSRLERLSRAPLPPDVEAGMHHWLAAIRAVQGTRQEEREAMADPARRGQWDEREVLAIAASIEDLVHIIQLTRNVLWSCLRLDDLAPLQPDTQTDILDDQQFTVSDEWDFES
ncbi:uncharacterized protein LOC134194736 isoform X2 [Corticium candelabrum]|uniref:uncharacterized protein LOC134194736 isoform X2 n=1 Tax=Corticium candelabrum TaxID=121492 RepID=UPI002E2760EA|nr:uncharacterized protein LOC134194736 isoform X2 [Corticium candelabrum]